MAACCLLGAACGVLHVGSVVPWMLCVVLRHVEGFDAGVLQFARVAVGCEKSYCGFAVARGAACWSGGWTCNEQCTSPDALCVVWAWQAVLLADIG
jgi:hypothetical protein